MSLITKLFTLSWVTLLLCLTFNRTILNIVTLWQGTSPNFAILELLDEETLIIKSLNSRLTSELLISYVGLCELMSTI